MNNSLNIGGALSGAVDNMLSGSIAGNIQLDGGGSANLKSLSVFANGEYLPPEGYDGFDSVIVDVPSKEEITANITENGTYTPPPEKVYSQVIVNVPTPSPVLQSKSITENGTYTPPSGVDGFNEVVVNVPSSQPVLQSKSITENGTYTPPSGVDGFNEVVVNVKPSEYFTITNKIYGESAMSYANVNTDKFDSVWNGGSAVGYSVNGLVNLRGKSKVIIDVDNIGTSYLNGQYPRFNFNCGLTTEIYNTFVLLDYNTSGKLVDYVIAPYSDYYGLSYHGEITIPDRDCYLYIGCNGVNAQGISVKVI